MLVKNRVTVLVFLLMSFVMLGLGIFTARHVDVNRIAFHEKIDLSQFHGTFLKTPRNISPFVLTTMNRDHFNNHNLEGHWTMMFFGFTNCGYVCPTALAELAKMYRILEQKGIKQLPQVVMVSVDPKRDTPERLAQYLHSFDPHFYGAAFYDDATAPAEEVGSLERMSHEMGVVYNKVVSKNNTDSYDIDHTGAVILLNPQGKLSGFFTAPHQANLLAEDYLLLVS